MADEEFPGRGEVPRQPGADLLSELIAAAEALPIAASGMVAPSAVTWNADRDRVIHLIAAVQDMWVACGWVGADGVHRRYRSTGCAHGRHAYCQSMIGYQGEKRPGQCKFCAATCICDCHRPGGTP